MLTIYNEPTTEYEVAFTFENNIANINCLNPQMMANATITNANQESGSQNKLYDAVIIGNGTPRDIAIVWKDKAKDNAIARVKKNQGYFVFVDCEPIAAYDIVGRYDVSGTKCQFTQQQQVDKLIAKGTKKNKGNFDGVIYANSKLDMVIKFKTQ